MASPSPHWLHDEPSVFLQKQNRLLQTNFLSVELRFAISHDDTVLVFGGNNTVGVDPVDGSSLEAQILQKLKPMLLQGKLKRTQLLDFGFQSPLYQHSDDGLTMKAVTLIKIGSHSVTEDWLGARFSDDLRLLSAAFGPTNGAAVLPRLKQFNRQYIQNLWNGMASTPDQAMQICRDTIESELKVWSMFSGRPLLCGLIAYIFEEPEKGTTIVATGSEGLAAIRSPGYTEMTLKGVRYQILTYFDAGQVILEDNHLSNVQLVTRLFQNDGRINIQCSTAIGSFLERSIHGQPLYRNSEGDIRDSPAEGFAKVDGFRFGPWGNP